MKGETQMKALYLTLSLLSFCGGAWGDTCDSHQLHYDLSSQGIRSADLKVPIRTSKAGWKLHLAFDAPVLDLHARGYKVNRKEDADNEFHLFPRQKVKRRFPQPGGVLKLKASIKYDAANEKLPAISKLTVPGYSCRVRRGADNAHDDPGKSCPLFSCHGNACEDIIKIESNWADGMIGYLNIPIPSSLSGGWEMKISFNDPFVDFENWVGDVTARSTDGRSFLVRNKAWIANVAKGLFRFQFQVKKNPGSLQILDVKFQPKSCPPLNIEAPVTSAPTTAEVVPTSVPEVTTGAPTYRVRPITYSVGPPTYPVRPPTYPVRPPTYPVRQSTCQFQKAYQDVLRLSNMFYEAQRSGKLPTDMRVKWRKDSALNDAVDADTKKQIDLEGGYYDGGDYVKFGFPMAAAITNLAWGFLAFEDGYGLAGEHAYGLKTIRWATDYFIKCHPAKFVFYGQVGNGDVDHAYWGRPEDMTMERPAYKITDKKPGSELAGETAAALAASSLVFRRNGDVAYADTLLRHAKELYEFADTYRGNYHTSIPDAAKFYRSYSGYEDELAVAALWLYKATKDTAYLTKVVTNYQSNNTGEFSWDNKFAAIPVVLYGITKQQKYANDVKDFCDSIFEKGKRTPGGLVWISQWGSNRHAANVAFLCLIAASDGVETTKYLNFARDQILFMLGKLGKLEKQGSSGRSYVVGYGTNPPQRPHHASSSCPNAPAPCDWSTFDSAQPNPHVLYGALVGGPDEKGNYEDKRSDYVKNAVTCDFNAGFQSALAGLITMAAKGKC